MNYTFQERVRLLTKTFKDHFEGEPSIVRSPGRVNLIGEHTDYNDGFVLPAAVDKNILLAVRRNGGTQCRLYAVDMKQSFTFSPGELRQSELGWPNYLMGVVDQVNKAGLTVGGFDCCFTGDIPVGAGMSSSAALEAGLLYSLDHLHGWGLEKIDIVKMAQAAENEFVGVKCGIMDQYINIYGKAGHVLKIDCRSLDYEYVPFNMEKVRIVLCDTQVKHSLASSEYNVRRQQCEEGVAILQKSFPEIKALRDVTPEMLEEKKDEMDEVTYRRCRYVTSENKRLAEGCEDLQRGDLEAFGRKMFATHKGLSEEYEVSCPELDVLAELAANDDAVLGARMMGGGFGGCTINLVKQEDVDAFVERMKQSYKEKTGKEILVYLTAIEEGTALV